MGYDMGLYMGVFVKVKGGPKEFKKKAYVNSNGKEQSTRFNPSTGEEHRMTTITEVRNVEPNCYDLPDHLNEDEFWNPEFCGADQHWQNFMYQGEHDKYTTKLGDPENGMSIELPEFNKHQIIEDFKLEYKEYLDYWKEQYNEVEVTYGLIAYWS